MLVFLLLFCYRRFGSSRVNSLVRLPNHLKTRLGIDTETLARVSLSLLASVCWTAESEILKYSHNSQGVVATKITFRTSLYTHILVSFI